MNKVQVTFYDGQLSKPFQATLQALNDESVVVIYGHEQPFKKRVYAYSDMMLIGALGKLNPVIELSDDARLEFNGALPEWFNLNTKKTFHMLWKLEKTPSLIIFSIVFVASLVFATIKWGVPTAAHYIAHQLPETTLKRLGDESEQYVYQLTDESELSDQRQKQIIQQYHTLLAGKNPAKIVFRKGGELGANALAIPNNTIVVTDELVELVEDDREIIGVLAHEQGHLDLKHSLQQTVSGLGFSVLWMVITGDSSNLLTTLPAAAIGAKYSRDFESEADQYALEQMYKQKIPTIYFAQFLERLSEDDEESDTENNAVMGMLQSHPATKERVEAVKKFEQTHQ
jgi:Zn-dependent protease with chaperone function